MEANDRDRFAQGSVIGDYRMVRLLGEGGMSRVYEVVHERLCTRFALKVFARTGKGDVAFLRALYGRRTLPRPARVVAHRACARFP